jgi:trypsin
VLCASSCSALSGGTNAIAGQFPFYVALNVNGVVCGGVILNQNNVLTAASCFLNNNTLVVVAPNQVNILAGQLVLSWAQPLTATRAIYLHPQYNPYTLENDIAVVRVSVEIL